MIYNTIVCLGLQIVQKKRGGFRNVSYTIATNDSFHISIPGIYLFPVCRLGLESVRVPELESVRVPALGSVLLPELESIRVRELESVRVPKLESVRVPELESTREQAL